MYIVIDPHLFVYYGLVLAIKHLCLYQSNQYQNFHFRVSLHNVIKVADFGLSVTVGEDKDYFRISDCINEKLPVRWMAVETFIDYKFSEASEMVRSL